MAVNGYLQDGVAQSDSGACNPKIAGLGEENVVVIGIPAVIKIRSHQPVRIKVKIRMSGVWKTECLHVWLF